MPGAEVVLLCGVAGSGKTTYAQRLELQGYVRLSIDEQIWSDSGRYGVDYAADDYPSKLRQAEALLRQQLTSLVEDGQRVVIDSALWRRVTRDEYKQLVTKAGGNWRLVYLKATPETLRKRLRLRARRFDANAAFPITDELLATYLSHFEEPNGEGEEIVTVDDQ